MEKFLSARETLTNLRAQSKKPAGEDKIKSQHKKGKMTARERIEILLDPKSFIEIDAFVVHSCHNYGMNDKKFLGDGVVTGWGTIDKRTVYVFAQDFTVFGGSLSQTMAQKICKIMRLALQNGCPIIGLNDSGGARIHEGVESLGGYADIFKLNVEASGVIPQLSLIMGPCAGGAVYSPAITDFTFMVDETSHMFITGPNVIKEVTQEQVTFEELGGSQIHSSVSGVCDKRYSSETETLLAAREWLSYIPSNNLDHAPINSNVDCNENNADSFKEQMEVLKEIIPEESHQPYSMKNVILNIMDSKTFFETKEEYAANLLTGFARLNGQSVGIVANNPEHMAGVLDINASIKGARFIRFCDAFHIPIITFVDVPGFLPGCKQEEEGIIRHGAKILYAYCEATTPLLTVITRKAYGGAYDVMSSKHVGADLNLAWPTAEIAVMGAKGACNIIFKEEIKMSLNTEETQNKFIQEYKQKFSNPYRAAEKGYVDAVILPEETRQYLIKGLETCASKKIYRSKRKHGNIPL
ncbi:MAG: methylmalonyl-CoA carboxyltransferase [Zetaproteobacteria bacterium]|nr:methylmalonyl-CoA carboxyltransferase [Pseudobdellovibrionaceae bacterium]